MQKEYNTKRCEFEMKQRELTALEDKWEDLKKEAIKPNSEEVPSKCHHTAAAATQRDPHSAANRSLKGLTPCFSLQNPLTRGIRALENRLDKAIIKYNEAQSIRKTYEQITKRLKDERITFDNQLVAIEKTLKAKEHDYEELLLMAHDANHAKEAARAELARFEQAVAEERRQREKELNERRAQARARQEMMTRAENREKMRQEIILEAQG